MRPATSGPCETPAEQAAQDEAAGQGERGVPPCKVTYLPTYLAPSLLPFLSFLFFFLIALGAIPESIPNCGFI